MRSTDWETTYDALEEAVARESYLSWLRENEQRGLNGTQVGRTPQPIVRTVYICTVAFYMYVGVLIILYMLYLSFIYKMLCFHTITCTFIFCPVHLCLESWYLLSSSDSPPSHYCCVISLSIHPPSTDSH